MPLYTDPSDNSLLTGGDLEAGRDRGGGEGAGVGVPLGIRHRQGEDGGGRTSGVALHQTDSARETGDYGGLKQNSRHILYTAIQELHVVF